MSAVSLIASPQCILFCKPFPPPSSKHRVRRLKFRRHGKPIFLASASASSSSDGGDNPSGFSWERLGRSLRFGSERFMTKFSEAAKKETGIDLEDANKSVAEFSGQIMDGVDKVDSEFRRLRFELVPAFIQWNKLDNWKDVGSWDIKRIAVLVLYAITVMVSCVKLYAAVEAPRKAQQKKELTEAYMEALIPEPTPANVRKLKKGMWRKTVPKGLRMKKFIEGSDGSLLQDSSYVGEDAWDNEVEQLTSEKANEMVGVDASLEEKKGMEGGLSLSATQDHQLGTWRERLHAWKEILEMEKVSDQLVSSNAKYAVEFDMKEVENSLRKDLVEKSSESTGSRALWISKRWWRYRPKLPYMYFLQKLDSSEVAAVVFTEDLKQVYVTMKEGFPLEYIVDIPLDPFLFETISNSAVEVDLLQKRQMHYFLRVVIAILPGIVILCLIRDSMGLLLFVSRNVVRKKYNQLLDLAYSKNFFMSRSKHGSIRKMYREVILGGDVWDLLDEFMHFMDDPMRYYEKGVPFSRGMLLSGPPGTGKTLFARTLAKQCGLPFVFASGADFSDSERSGTARVRELFALARRNTPSFIFVDEIDAVAGKNARKDPRMREAFDELIAQLDGLKERTGVDRFSLSQAFIFICATNRPDEIDPELLRPGRVDRRVYIGLPNERRRVQIFNLHSTRMQLAEDVDFGKLVFRTVGYSGADIRSLVNEAGIMSVRKGHSKICQQDIVDVLDKQLLEGLGVLLTEEEQRKCEERVSLEKKRLLAVHEAGHILLAHLFPTFDWHAFSQLLPGGKETAMSVFYPREEMVECETATYGYMIMQMVVAHGGLCAEKVVFGDVTDGGKDDLNKITRIARELVISPRNERLGFATLIKKLPGRFPSDDNELITYKWDKPGFYPVEMDAEVSELFTRELTRYIQETEDMAMKGLKDNRHILDHIAKELLEKMRITGQEAAERIKELSPVMFEDYGIQLVEMDQEEPWPHLDRLPDRPMDIYPAPLHRC